MIRKGEEKHQLGNFTPWATKNIIFPKSPYYYLHDNNNKKIEGQNGDWSPIQSLLRGGKVNCNCIYPPTTDLYLCPHSKLLKT